MILWALTLIRPDRIDAALPVSVPLVLGSVAALQFLVKFGAGAGALGAALIVAVARCPWLRNVVLLTASFLASFLTLWTVAQQSPADITEWWRRSLQVAGGYSAAMARFPGSGYWLVWLVAVAVLCCALWRLVRHHQARSLPSVALVAFAVWFFTKEGFTRLDPLHFKITALGLAVLIAAITWERRWIPLGVLGMAVVGVAIVATGGLATHPTQGVGEAGRILRSTIQPSFRTSELTAARRSLDAYYGISKRVVTRLRGAEVHADPTEIAAVWAYGLRWRPVPVFQTYSAYTPFLDQVNADSLRSRDGPNAVIRQADPRHYLGRVPAGCHRTTWSR